MDLRPRVVSVGMNAELGTPIDYGWKRLLACGFFSTILILDPESAKIYSCQQRDVFFCLHENGSLSVYARQGLACSVKASVITGRAMPVLRPDPVESVGELYDYELVAFTGESRSPRSSGPIRLSVDQSREVSAAVTSNDGRIKADEAKQCQAVKDAIVIHRLHA
ncbi:hypothetical protein FBUS_04176 [Fasciolopsis buskii]|uniref:Uncharacterized protein n=1 Tax=Fasciolopsis buskii TaxID=27845 RepID=A0A8E0S321_9TREM|nr:hypothetical protein FBUS_04176 [Fasciolopsis buski]